MSVCQGARIAVLGVWLAAACAPTEHGATVAVPAAPSGVASVMCGLVVPDPASSSHDRSAKSYDWWVQYPDRARAPVAVGPLTRVRLDRTSVVADALGYAAVTAGLSGDNAELLSLLSSNDQREFAFVVDGKLTLVCKMSGKIQRDTLFIADGLEESDARRLMRLIGTTE